jgi:exodeoxyribonuclease-1
MARWEGASCGARLLIGGGGRSPHVDALLAEIDTLSETADARGEEILAALFEYEPSLSIA